MPFKTLKIFIALSFAVFLSACGVSIHDAVQKSDISSVKIMLNKGIDIDKKSLTGSTPLHVAAKTGNRKTALFLLENHADINRTNSYRKTPLHIAAERGNIEVVKLLIESGAKLNLLDNHGNTPLLSASEKGRINVVKLLIDKGAKRNRKNAFSETASDLARKNGHINVVFLLKSKGSIRAVKKTGIIRKKRENLKEGNYYALIIGNNKYMHLQDLKTAVNDAVVLGKILRNSYGFQTKLLLNSTKSSISRAINAIRKKVSANDNLLIYYAGHGIYDKKVNKAYWLPVDAENDDDTNWIIADTITTNIRRISAKHVLVISDSCYSGTLVRSASIKLRSGEKKINYLKRMLERPSRTLLSSGGNEPVADGLGDGHSVFANSLIHGLKNWKGTSFTAENLFYQNIKERVAGKSDQVPQYRIIRNSGHGGGDFVFKRKEIR